MVPAAVCASFAFMLPIAGPSNAIVFATGRITIVDMVRGNRPFSYSAKEPGSSVIFIHFNTRDSIE